MSVSKTILSRVNTLYQRSLKKELRQQGHYLTGGLERSIKGEIKNVGKGYDLTGVSLDYGQIVNTGVASSRVPFNRGSGAKKSKYIDALISYFQKRGLSIKEAQRAAFATATLQKKEGMPTSGSFKYSKNNKRTEFIDRTEQQTNKEVNNLVLSSMDKLFDKEYHKQKDEIIS